MRWAHKLYANFFGYFWLPCPICGEMFGGHEWRDPNAVLWKSEGGGEGVCQKCVPEAAARNKAAGMPEWMPGG